jgi:hypothetical protein
MLFEGEVFNVGVLSNGEWQALILCCAPGGGSGGRRVLQFYVTRLEEFSAPLVSPLFQHRVLLEEDESEKFEEKVIVFRLREWRSYALRIPPTINNEHQYVTKLKELVRHSFFPVMKQTTRGLVEQWHRQYFNWHCYKDGMAVGYRADFSVLEWLGKELTPLQYWQCFKRRYDTLEFVRTLEVSEATMSVHLRSPLGYLFCLFDQWSRHQPHLAGYFRYRMLDMEAAHAVANAQIPSVMGANLSLVRLRDLSHFCVEMSMICQPPPPSEDLIAPSMEYNDFTLVCGYTVKPQQLCAVLDHFYQNLNPIDGMRAVRHRFIERVVVRKMREEMERFASLSLATVLAVDAKQLLYEYRRVFGLRGGPKQVDDITLCHPQPSKSTNPPTSLNSDSLTFGVEDGCEVINQFITELRQRPRTKWHCGMQEYDTESGTLTVKPNTPLFFLCVRESDTLREEKLQRVVTEELHCMMSVHETPHSPEYAERLARDDPIRQSLLPGENAGQYDLHITVLLYTPLEVNENVDLDALHTIMRSNMFTSIVMRAGECDLSLRRASFYVHHRRDPELTPIDWHKRFFDVKSVVRENSLVVAREMLLLMDTHLWSTEELLTLFQWISRERRTVKRMVMFGARDMLPLASPGQPWLDLMSWFHYKYHAFRLAMLRRDMFDLLRMLVTDQRLSLCPSLDDLQKHLVSLMEKMSVRPAFLRLYCVDVPPRHNNNNNSQSMEKIVTDSFEAKFRSVMQLKVEQITLAQCATLPIAELCRQHGHARFFLVWRRVMVGWGRNEMNHLVLDTLGDPIIALDGEERNDAIEAVDGEWLLGRSGAIGQTYPNWRTTMTHLREQELLLQRKIIL